MGFWDLRAFNLALVAKQVWRMRTSNQSLIYRVFKKRYFPSCSFMEAHIGHTPYVWRCILCAGRVIKNGSIR